MLCGHFSCLHHIILFAWSPHYRTYCVVCIEKMPGKGNYTGQLWGACPKPGKYPCGYKLFYGAEECSDVCLRKSAVGKPVYRHRNIVKPASFIDPTWRYFPRRSLLLLQFRWSGHWFWQGDFYHVKDLFQGLKRGQKWAVFTLFLTSKTAKTWFLGTLLNKSAKNE